MKNYVIINGVNSLTITGLAISKLPSISKPPLRVMTEEINGRDGDLITELGYGAYDKELVIGLYGNYDINEVIGFFNQEGTIVFSNEDDKYYNFKIINQIDYEALIKFRTATINLHCQPFKYPLTETPEEITTEYVEDEGETLTLNDTKIAPLSIDLKGNTTQNGTPTPSSPIPVNVVSGDNEVVVCGKNLFNKTSNIVLDKYIGGDGTIQNEALNWYQEDYIEVKPSTNYIMSSNSNQTVRIALYDENKTFISRVYATGNIQATTTATTKYVRLSGYNNTNNNIMLNEGSTALPYEPYTSQNYPLYLGVENLFDITTLTDGYVNGDGSLNPAHGSQEMYSSFIKVEPNTRYVFTIFESSWSGFGNNMWIGIGEYTTNNTNSFVRRDTEYDLSRTYLTFATSETTNYLIVSARGLASATKVQLEKGSKANSYTPYGTTPIELNKIGNYQDYIYKNGSKWYLHKEIGKVAFNGTEYWAKRNDIQNLTNTSCFRGSYSDEVNNNALQGQTQFSNLFVCLDDTTDTEHIRKTGASNYRFQVFINKSRLSSDDATGFKSFLASNNMTIYYVLATPTNTEITNATLINQLENLKSANSYEGQTNISQVNNDLPFILKVKGTKEGSGEGIINNIGNIYAKPIIALEGTGNIGIYKNGTQYFEVDMSNDNEITIDTEKMEAYHNGVLKNRKVIGDYNKFTIDEGNNNIEITGELTKATISNYTRWL